MTGEDKKKGKESNCCYSIPFEGVCGRPLYDEKYCIFHSKDIEGKKDKFNDTFWKEFERQKTQKNYDFRGFFFPHGFIFIESNLQKAIFYEVNLQYANLNRADLRYADFNRADLRGANLYNANLFGADLRGAILLNANLSEAKIRAHLCSVNLSRAYLMGADLLSADLRDAILNEANLRYANLSEAKLQKANLRGADLRDADLKRADLSRANLHEVKLNRADLRGANLSNADIRDANLKRADLRDANLQEADLRNANLKRADLRDVSSQGADLRGAKLKMFKGFKRKTISDISEKDIDGNDVSEKTIDDKDVSEKDIREKSVKFSIELLSNSCKKMSLSELENNEEMLDSILRTISSNVHLSGVGLCDEIGKREIENLLKCVSILKQLLIKGTPRIRDDVSELIHYLGATDPFPEMLSLFKNLVTLNDFDIREYVGSTIVNIARYFIKVYHPSVIDELEKLIRKLKNLEDKDRNRYLYTKPLGGFAIMNWLEFILPSIAVNHKDPNAFKVIFKWRCYDRESIRLLQRFFIDDSNLDVNFIQNFKNYEIFHIASYCGKQEKIRLYEEVLSRPSDFGLSMDAKERIEKELNELK